MIAGCRLEPDLKFLKKKALRRRCGGPFGVLRYQGWLGAGVGAAAGGAAS